MANKEYTMSFKLGAQLSREFGTTFSSAQRQVSQIQREINALHQVQSNISSYQRQQKAVADSTRKLADLEKQYDNIQREIDETGEYSSDLENKLIDKKRAVDKAREAVERETGKLHEMEGALRDAGVETDDLSGESDRLEGEMRDLAEEMKKTGEKEEDFGEKGAEAFETISSAAIAAGLAKILKEIAEAYAECIRINADFEESMSTVRALSGATDDEINTLNETAKKLGATTKFTAKESADAMTYMAMAGWDAEQMVSGMDGVLALAAASGEDLATTADIVTDNLTAFGMKASDTSRFADVLAAAATNSNTSVSVMGETFKNCAALAGALGFSVEDVAVTVGLMANAGIKGSAAGTALKNVFNGLLDGVTLTSEAFGELKYSAMNSDGTMKEYSQIINDLRGYFDQMTGAEKMANAETLAGQRAMAGFVSIMNSTDEDFNKLTESINNSAGAAQKMADIKMDNLNGDVTLLNSAADGLKNTLGGLATDTLRPLTQTATEILTTINTFVQNHPKLTKAIMAITAEAAAFLIVYKGYKAIKSVMNTLHAASTVLLAKQAGLSTADAVAKAAEASATSKAAAAQTALNAAQAASPYGWVALAIGAVVAGITALVIASDDAKDATSELTASSKAQYEEIQRVNAEYEKACELYGETSYEAQSLSWELDNLNDEFESGKKYAEEYYGGIEKELEAIQRCHDEYDETVRSLEYEAEGTSALIEKLVELSSTSYDAAQNQALIIPIVDELNRRYSDLGLSLDKVTGQLNMSPEELREFAKEQAVIARNAEEYKRYQEILAGNGKEGDDAVAPLETRKAKLKELEEEEKAALETYEYYQKQVADLQEQYDKGEISYEVFTERYMPLTGPYADAEEEYNRVHGLAERARKEISEDEQFLIDYETRIGVRTADTILTTEEQLDSLSTVYSNAVGQIVEEYNKLYEAAKESFDKQFSLFDEAKADSGATVEAAQKALDSQLKYWETYGANIETIKNVSASKLGVTQETYDSFMAYVRTGTEEAAGLAASMANAIEKGDTEAVATLVKTFDAVQTERDNAAKEVAEWTLDFAGKMDEVVKLTKDAVDAMELDDEAAAAAKSTIESYAQSLLDGGIEAVKNAELIALQVSRALNKSIHISTSNSGAISVGYYASGTDYAPPGWAWVGEEGPELMRLSGGEKILSAQESRSFAASAEALSAKSYGGQVVSVTIAPSFTVNGEASDGQLSEFRDELISEVVDALEERGVDARRSVYA